MTTLSTSTTTTGVTSSQSTTKRLTSTTIPTTSLMTTAPKPWCLSYLGNGGFNHGWLWNLWSRDRWWRMLLGLNGHWSNHFLRKRKKQLWRKQHWKRYPHCMFIVILYFEHHTPNRIRHDITEILLKLTLNTNQST